MIRLLELFVSLLIVVLLAVLVGAFLPSHGHIERVVEVSSPVRQVYDSLNTFRRFPEWAALRAMDPKIQMNLEGAESGVDAKVTWKGNEKVGTGNLAILSSEQDSRIVMGLNNAWSGADKTYTINLEPSANGKTVKIKWAYDAEYGWNLIWRYAGMYIHGDPATIIQANLNNIAAMLATFPNVDYKDQPIEITDVIAKPVLLVSTRAKRSLEEVTEATDKALAEIEDELKKIGLNAVGPRIIITTNWGDEDYVFDVAVPVDSTALKIGTQDHMISLPTMRDKSAEEISDTPKTFNPGDQDDNGYLVLSNTVRATVWPGGKALVTHYTGSPAVLPLLRLMLKAYAETHGYAYSEADGGRFWDELNSDPETTAEDEQEYSVYLPVQI